MHTVSAPYGDPRDNHFLASLPESVWARWRHQLEPVDLSADQQLHACATSLAYLHFPTTAMVSLLYLTKDGASTEICAVGSDGVVGIDSLMGANTAQTLAVVQRAGQGYRLPSQAVRQELTQAGPALPVMLRYAHSLVAKVAQTAVCNHFHSVEQRVCRRLLISLDQAPQNEVALTHQQFSNLLGVRRESVTAVAHKLQGRGVIRYHRGHITVLDRQGLEQGACECYAMARQQYERTLPMPLAA
ncbi:Crp/Fnr family transcriptional regulator [Hydrogenophaga sp. A37]|uniref:Crp/Fnr family transcriptional regulator n=1 Tax=Hydrogenophaga sp. A37 TaxID=1945864 RepID=UPI000985D083|nr:Crp/Fnr family transcriptional regulator [Hydrogenophaga sp. A37]OOG79078.1 Crp/Fnr family transcriptional regulator [Hydrogenophaga sp. A37]